jgi:hypothetical protein
MPRKSKLTPEVEKELLQLIQAGVPKDEAAAAVGVHRATFYRWQADNATFATAVEKAFGRCVATKVLRIRKAEDDSWQAAAWWLERRMRQDFGRVDRMELTGKDGGSVSVEFYLPSNGRETTPEYQPSRNGHKKEPVK